MLDPFGVSHASSSFNPLSMIDGEADTAVDDAALVAEALVIQEEGPDRQDSQREELWQGLRSYQNRNPFKPDQANPTG